MNVSDKNT